MNDYNSFELDTSFRDYMNDTYMATALGVAISMAVSFVVSLNPAFIYRYSYLYLAAGILELVVAGFFGMRLMKMSKTTAWICYVLYSALTGFTLSSIFFAYSMSSITSAFASTVVLFVCMAIIGKTTKVDLTKFSGILFAGLIALIISSLLNAFLFRSTMFEFIISFVGIVLFLGLVAFDIQKLRDFYTMASDGDTAEKLMVYGAFQLYLDFINLFIRILSIFGSKDND
ncbi:MAG: Bax inhibitor-1/YccA family protein [Erysipelotrichaceae bacterium]|nr:Bax inhibitor-1/YccA family protein [Erysipelotrichaceae bacterium]